MKRSTLIGAFVGIVFAGWTLFQHPMSFIWMLFHKSLIWLSITIAHLFAFSSGSKGGLVVAVPLWFVFWTCLGAFGGAFLHLLFRTRNPRTGEPSGQNPCPQVSVPNVLVVLFAVLCLLSAGIWSLIIIFVIGMSGMGDGAATGLTPKDVALLCVPCLYLLLFFIASFRFIPFRPAIIILVGADALLLIVVFACFHMGGIIGLAVIFVLMAVGLVGHWLLLNDKKRIRQAQN